MSEENGMYKGKLKVMLSLHEMYAFKIQHYFVQADRYLNLLLHTQHIM